VCTPVECTRHPVCDHVRRAWWVFRTRASDAVAIILSKFAHLFPGLHRT